MKIERRFVTTGERLSAGAVVTDVRVGLGYTAVQVDGGDVGLAYTFRSEAGHTCTALKMAGDLTGKPAEELISWVEQEDVIASSLALATFNAVCQKKIREAPGGDFLTMIHLGPGDKVGMVGFFAPLIKAIRDTGSGLLIFEKNLARGKDLFPPEQIPDRLPGCSVVILSATTLINHTFEHIVSYAARAREVILLGPSTPLAPEIMEIYGVTLLAGMKIVAPGKVLRIVSEGGGTQRLGSSVKKIVIPCGLVGKPEK
jgi:uncharacterized protein (DUF4213/DUF364 family)